jgi:hypothetical protein
MNALGRCVCYNNNMVTMPHDMMQANDVHDLSLTFELQFTSQSPQHFHGTMQVYSVHEPPITFEITVEVNFRTASLSQSLTKLLLTIDTHLNVFRAARARNSHSIHISITPTLSSMASCRCTMCTNLL